MNTSEKVGLAVEMRLPNSPWAEVAGALGYAIRGGGEGERPPKHEGGK
jgi:hypothetical protein